MTTHHSFGPELDRKPTTYTCWCGFRSADYAEVTRHITDERAIEHAPRRLTTVPVAVGSPTAGIEIASTPHGDEHDAVEIRMIVPDGGIGSFRRHMVIVHRSNLPFLIEELEAHRLDKDLDPCAACAAQTFAARLTDDAARTKRTCPETPQSRSSEAP